ncbi:MAG: hypothetical protein GAK45_01366 [Pseudomonas citronellolis]|nr:MAG: hypothetical protein GAK45_01366 [Pseudomonas citronellolis]
MRLPLLALPLLLTSAIGLAQATPDVLRLASSPSSLPTLSALIDQYQLATGHKVLLIEGSAAALAQEVQAGVPYDLFFSDDPALAAALHAQGLGDTPRAYTCGAEDQALLVRVQGPRRYLAEQFLDYLAAHPAAGCVPAH